MYIGIDLGTSSVKMILVDVDQNIIATSNSSLSIQSIADGYNEQNPKEWIFTKFAGILLLIPGFITDLCGIFLLIKSLRYLIWDFVPDNTKNYFYNDQKKSKDKEIIEVDYKDLDDK